MAGFLSVLRSRRAADGVDRPALWRLLEEFLKRRSRAQRASRFTALLMFGRLALPMLLVVTGGVGLLVVSWRKFHV